MACFNKTVPYNNTCRQEAVIVSGEYITPVAGTASFPEIVVNRAGVNYSLTIYSSQVISIVSPFFTIEHSQPYELVVTRLPLKKIISEPFGVQPLLALVDEFGNICLKESMRFVQAALHSNSSMFFLAGVPRIRLRGGLADFHNLAIEASSLVTTITTHALRFECVTNVSGIWTTFQATTPNFDVDPGVFNLSVGVQPSTSVAGQNVGGVPVIYLESSPGSLVGLANRTISARIVESDCPERYPVPQPIVPLVVQAEMRGAVPIVAGQAFVVTSFRAVGFSSSHVQRAFVKIVDSDFDCETNQIESAGDVGATVQTLFCYDDGTCVSEADPDTLYLSFTLTMVPASGRVRLCVKAEGHNYGVVPVSLQQTGTWKLWTNVPIVAYDAPIRIPAHRIQPIDHVTLWWAGRDFDTCDAFHTSASDARIAFVLSRDVVWNASHVYSCPRHPRTGQVYRWASSEEVLALGTLFTENGAASPIYTTQCGLRSARVLSTKQAFLFSDFAKVGVHAKSDRFENQALSYGTPDEANIAGLVCVSDEVFLQCTTKCHNDRCPAPDEQPGHVDEQQSIILRWTQHAQNQSVTYGRRLLSSPAAVSPSITSDLRSELTGNTLALASGMMTLHLTLQREPASWVTLVPNDSPHPEFVTWEAGAKLEHNAWSHGVRFVFGGKGAGWDYSRHEAHHALEWDMVVTHNITCGAKCAEWPINTTVELMYTLYSSVQSYNGTRIVIAFRKAPDNASMAAELMGPSVIYAPPPLQFPETPAPEVVETPTPGPALDFCIRAGAHWRIGGDPEGTEMCRHNPSYKCGVIWCGERVKQVESGGYHSCAIDQDDKLMCWGRNNTGQAGPPWKVQSSAVKSVDAGTYHTCAVLGDDSVSCWGDNLRGQTTVPAAVSSWKSVSCGTAHSCAIDAVHVGHCWGDGTYGQSDVPAEATNLASISAGFFHTCAVGLNGNGYCWGSLLYDYKQTVLPVRGPWKQISAGNLHTCGVLVNGTALCWGLSNSGQTQVPPVGTSVSWRQVSSGLLHSCGITSDGHMRCWGSVALNRLFVKPSAAGPWTQVSTGYEHSCGLMESGRIACWGSAGYGQLAVSAAQYVSYDPPCSAGHIAHSASDLLGHRACNANAGDIQSFVDVSMLVKTTQANVYYTVASASSNAVVSSPLQYLGPLRFDVTVTVSAEARSLDAEVTTSDMFSYTFVVQVGLPTVALVAPNVVLGSAYYYTGLEILLTGDASLNPFGSTSIYFTTNGVDPSTNGELYVPAYWTMTGGNQSEYHNALVLGNTTADAFGTSSLRVIAKRPGAVDSTVRSLIVVTKVAPIHFAPSNVSVLVTNAQGIEVLISTATPDVEIFYTVCIPSRCQVPENPTGNSTRFAGHFTVNETGTIVRSIGFKNNLATSAVAEIIYNLKLQRPVMTPPPNSSVGFLAPVSLVLKCGSDVVCVAGMPCTYPLYSLDGSVPSLIFTSALYLERNLTVRAICVRRMRLGMLLDSEETTGNYDITILEILDSPVTESSMIARAVNRITVSIKTTLAITQNTSISITGLVGSATEDHPNIPLSLPGLQASWTQATGTLAVTVLTPPTSAEPVFAVTDSQHCAERLPLTVLDLATCDPRSTCNAQLSSRNFDVVHGGWEQEFYVDGLLKMTIEYFFEQRCTLRDRLTGSHDAGNTNCDVVRWRVVYHGPEATSPLSEMSGFYQFSQLSRANSMYASNDDGAWGAADGEHIISNGPRPQNFWGQGVFDSADAEPGECDSLYIGNDSRIRSDSLRSVVKLTRVDAALVFSFVLVNPAESRSPVTPQIVMKGGYCDALGCSVQQIGPAPMIGSVLGASLSFGLMEADVQQTTTIPGANSIVSLALKTNLKISPEECLPHCDIHISELPGMALLPVQMGRTTIPETKPMSFDCNGYRTCQTTLKNYLPADAIFVSADIDVFIACSDFNGADEFVKTLMVGGANVESITKGPWVGCEASCSVEKQVLRSFNVTGFKAGEIPIYLAASQSVDAYSCSQTSTLFVRARIVVNVQYYYSGTYLAGITEKTGVIAYTLRPANLDPGCVEGAYSLHGPAVGALEWQDSAGYRCKDYAAFQWCDMDRCGGDQWTCAEYAVNETSARDVCCACGGGQRWWTRVSFALSNSMSAGAREPRVAIVRADGFVLLNQTLVGHLLGSPDAPASASVRKASLAMAPAVSISMRRRLLQQAEGRCTATATIQVMWPVHDMELYTCGPLCWVELERQVAKAVAETVVTTTANVHVTLSAKNDTDVTAFISILGDSDDECVAIANNVEPLLVARALSTQRLLVDAAFSPGGSPVAYSASGSVLPALTVMQAGFDSIGDWHDANFAGFRNETEVAYVQEWESGRVLTSNHSVVSRGGIASLDRVVVNKACSGYRLRIFTLISDTILKVTSDAFVVRAGTVDKLYVSPVPTMLAHNPRWPCWAPQSCPATAVVAGMYFVVTATVVDALDNVCLDAHGSVSVSVVIPEENTAMVYGDNGEMLRNGSRVLKLRITQAFQDGTNNAQLAFTYMPQNFDAHSQVFAVYAAPLAALRLEAVALDQIVYAGDMIAPSLQLYLRDPYGNAVLEYLEIVADVLNEPDVLQGKTIETSREGVVSFGFLFIEKAAAKYSIVFSCDGVVNVSRTFEVVHADVDMPGAGSTLVLDRYPANAVAGEAWTVQPRLRLVDAYGNTAIRQEFPVSVAGEGLAGTPTALMVRGIGSFTDLVIMSPGIWNVTFHLTGGLVSIDAEIDVGPSLAKLQLVQQPVSTMVRICATPYPSLELLSADDRPVNNSRKDVKIDIAVNVFRMTNEMSCGSGGCYASTSFRFFLPPNGQLVKAFLDVDIAKTDFDEEEEFVEYILINGVPWAGNAASPGGRCNPNAADMCFSYHKCVSRLDVSDLARDNYLTVTTKISAAVNDFCAPRLQARVQLYGNYRPQFPETTTMVQNAPSVPLGGLTMLKTSGRTLVFKDLFFPVPGYGYRLRLYTDAGSVSTESEPFDVWDTASKADLIQQPGQAMAGETIRTQPVLQYLDQFNNPVTTFEPHVVVSIGTAQRWNQTLNDGFGGWQDLTGTDMPVLSGVLSIKAEGGVVQFFDVTVDRPVERLTLFMRACLVGPSGLIEGACVEKESIAFAVAEAVKSLQIDSGSLPASVKAGYMLTSKILLYNGDTGVSPSTSTVEVSAVNAADKSNPVKGKVAIAASNGLAVFSEFYFDVVGDFNVTFKVERAGVVLAMVQQRIVVEAGEPVSIVVRDNGVNFQALLAGQPFVVELEILDKFGNRNLAPQLTPVARAAQGSNYRLYIDTTSDSPNLIQNKTADGIVSFRLRVDAAQEVTVDFAVALSPADYCSVQEISNASSSDCPVDARGLQYCDQADFFVDPSACLNLPLCSYISVSQRCSYPCVCSGGVRQSWCSACVATTSLDLRLYASESGGDMKLSMIMQPGSAVDGMLMDRHPTILVQVCTSISSQCNPIANVWVFASLQSSEDQYTRVGQPSQTVLNCPQSGNCSAMSDYMGVATFTDLIVDSPGSDGAGNVILNFTARTSAQVSAQPFDLIAQQNQAPDFVDPTPVLCEDDDTPLVYYATVGSRVHVVLKASDMNTAPYDDLTMEVVCNVVSSPGFDECEKVLPSGAYLTENIYSSAVLLLKPYIPECDEQKSSAAQGEPKKRQVRQKNNVDRHFVWSPVSWYPMLSMRYKSVEAARNGALASYQLSTCERTVQVVVCDRPRFIAPSPMGADGHLMVLANTDIEFTVAALDRNQDDVVEIILSNSAGLNDMSVVLGPNVHHEKLLVTGLETTSRNRVSREVTWSIPNDGIMHTVCFRARDNQFPCGDGDGLVSEDRLCVHCTLEPLGVYITCSSTLKAENLDDRLAPIICGDGRMTDIEECDDGNLRSGDGCSSLCYLEEGYDQLGSDPRPKNVCGDGLVVIGETCDDNNNITSDGCSDTCQTEIGFTCLECGGYTECLPTCGDGNVTSNHLRSETCDGGEGCSAECSIEIGWQLQAGEVNLLEPICGDGLVRGDEECDDKNNVTDDGCSDECKIEANWDCGTAGCLAICGDGVRAGQELCDDGNLLASDGCDPTCRIETFFFCEVDTPHPDICRELCGDGERVQSNISRVRAGFDRINACDDGNNHPYDGCSPTCEIEDNLGWECNDNMSATGTPQSPRSVCGSNCGDGMRTEMEECDDGNLLNKDGCSSRCTVETGYVCYIGTAGTEAQMLMNASSCINTLQANGTCCYADGNASDAKTCSSNTEPGDLGAYCLSKLNLCSSSQCEPTVGKSEEICFVAYMGLASLDVVMGDMRNVSYLERGIADLCTSSCGDGHRALAEECDDANLEAGDGCSSTCLIEAGWYCLHQPGPAGDFCSSICGDAVLVPGVEECDDGAWTEPRGDGCTSLCKSEMGFNCTYDQQNRLYGGRCKPICGDGRWVLGEACDDENLDDNDGCSSECKVEDGWVCGADSSRPDMNTSVCIGLCGDGIKVSGEECDDNNIRDRDGCTQSCKIEPGFACTPAGDCFTVCGDGVVMGKESCDDANQMNGDGCTNDCLIEHGYQCIAANCSGSACQLQEGGLGSHCQECPPVRQTAVRCSHPPCPVVGLTADCSTWFFDGDGGWIRKEELPVSSFSMQCRPEWYGDGFCDALNNREECGFDLGDCCQKSCGCGGATSRACYNGVMGGCGRFLDKKGDYRCIQLLHPETGENLAADVAAVNLVGGRNMGSDLYGPYLSWVQIELTSTSPDIAVYFSTDGKPPAEETTTQLVIHGQPYVGPFNVTSTTLVRVSTVLWGLGVGQISLPIQIQVAKPAISPSPLVDEIIPSPVLVSIVTETPGATIKYTLSGSMGASDEQFVYSDPFAVNSVSTVAAWAEKEGAMTSERSSVSYALKATTPMIAPPQGAYMTEVRINVSSDTVLADVYVTVCNRTVYPDLQNKSIGQIHQTPTDVYCFPTCKGLCAGGFNDKKACLGASDLLTCGGGGSCVESYHLVHLCFPHEWPPGRSLWSEPIIINQTSYGSGTWITSYATRGGMADSNFTTQQYEIITEKPTLNVLAAVHAAVPWPNANVPMLSIPFEGHGQSEGPYPSPLSFNFSNPTPVSVFYTLDGSLPTPGAPGTIQVRFSEIQAPLLLNRTANITWVGLAHNLALSGVQSRSIAVQAVAPELIINVRDPDKSGPMDSVYTTTSSSPYEIKLDLERGLVTEGFVYPGLDKVKDETDHFRQRIGSAGYYSGWPMFSLRSSTQDAHLYYRRVNASNGSSQLATWPITGVRSGTTEPHTTQGLHARGWIKYTRDDEIEFKGNVTLEIMTASPGTTLINSNVMSYPLFIRERCEQGQASIDGYGPCALCPLDAYTKCNGYNQGPPCTCIRCDSHANDTGTFELGSPHQDLCKPFCRPGSFSYKAGIDENRTNCTACDLGTYEDRTRSTGCKTCPAGTSTWRFGSDDITHCRGAGGLVAGGFHTCGVDVDGAAKCWGYNGFGQTDVPKKLVQWEENGVPYAEQRDDAWYSVVAGSFHSCGITKEMKAQCWGQEFAGKTVVPAMHLYDSPSMPLEDIKEWQSISASAGYHHTCGIADGRALCWGDDEYQQTQVPKGRHWLSISAGQFHTCGIDSKGINECWGDDSYGQSHVPVLVNGGPWRNVSAGHYHSCGVSSAGKMHCWGSSLYEATAFPQDVESWASVAVGRYHSCGVTFDGDMRCWGSNQDGAVTVPDTGITRWRAVTAGLFHTCGIAEDRTGVCWGRTVYGLTILPNAPWSSV